MFTDEAHLMRAARQNNEEALEVLFRRHVERAVRVAYLITGDWTVAEDVAQEAFLRAFKSLHTFRDGSPFAPWFTTIVVNQARKTRQRNRRDIDYAGLVEAVEPCPTPEEAALKQEKRQGIMQAVSALDEKHRLPVLLKYFGGFSEEEAAAALGIPVSTVKSRLYTARQRLKKRLRGSKGDINQNGQNL